MAGFQIRASQPGQGFRRCGREVYETFVELLALVQLQHREGSGNRRKIALVDHHEAMRALVDDFKRLALVKQQDASPERDSGHGEQQAMV